MRCVPGRGLSCSVDGSRCGGAEWIVTGPGGEKMVLQLAYFDRGCDPVVMDLGPVLDLEDAVGGKVCALASRVEPRDYADVAAALGRYSPAQLINFARRLDPGRTGGISPTQGWSWTRWTTAHSPRWDSASIRSPHCGSSSRPGPGTPGPPARKPDPAAQPSNGPDMNPPPRPNGTTRRPSHNRSVAPMTPGPNRCRC